MQHSKKKEDKQNIDACVAGKENMQEELHFGMLNHDILEQMCNEQLFDDLANVFKIFGDKTRIKILKVLRVQDMCVHDLAHYVNMSQSAVSHQLRVLKQARLVRGVRSGKSVIYSLDDDHVKKILDMGIDHVSHL